MEVGVREVVLEGVGEGLLLPVGVIVTLAVLVGLAEGVRVTEVLGMLLGLTLGVAVGESVAEQLPGAVNPDEVQALGQGQGRQKAEEVAPGALLYVPVAHGVHTEAPTEE